MGFDQAGAYESSANGETIIGAIWGDQREDALPDENMVQKEEDIKEVIRNKHPHLNSGDMELCTLIVQQKSVSEIAKLQGIKTHSVTARRSRLRTKLGLDREQNLNDYLISVARREM